MTVLAPLNLPEVHFASLNDHELARYLKLLEELREQVTTDEPKKIIGTVKR